MPTMFQRLLFVIAGMSASLAQNSTTGTRNSSLVATASSQRFSQCPALYTDFCFHGTCRFLIREWEPSCLCSKGYRGSRCEHMDLLQVMTGDPRSFVVVIVSVISLIVLTLIGSICLNLYLCRKKRGQSQVNLLKNVEVNDV